eukprot:RCo036761
MHLLSGPVVSVPPPVTFPNTFSCQLLAASGFLVFFFSSAASLSPPFSVFPLPSAGAFSFFLLPYSTLRLASCCILSRHQCNCFVLLFLFSHFAFPAAVSPKLTFRVYVNLVFVKLFSFPCSTPSHFAHRLFFVPKR